MKSLTEIFDEMDERELYFALKDLIPEKDFKEIYGDWEPPKQLKLFEGSDESQGF